MAKKIKQPLTNAQKRKKKRRTIIIIEAIILVIALIALAIWLNFGQIGCENLGQLAKNNLSTETIDLLKGYKCIAFFGVDNRSNGNYESGNSDSIMVACINNDTKEVRVISLYRDTVLEQKDGTLRKCNYAYNHGGAAEAIEMLNKNLDLDIQAYVAVDFNALADVIDDIGGVEIDLTAEEAKLMNDDYIGEVAKITGKKSDGVAAGHQTLNGVEATAYCRLRYTSGGDFKRAERQRTVLSQMVNKLKNMNASQMLKLATDENVLKEISTSLSPTEIAALASAMRDYTLGATTGFPFDKTTGTYGSKGSLVVPCTLDTNVSKLFFYLFNKENYVPSETVKKVSKEIVDLTGKTEKSAEHDEY